MELIRIFHPIGQGAFYTEQHDFNGTKFTIVYDCGSTTFKEKNMEKRIKSSFPKNCQIDILFISHFHEDHVSGIEILAKHCKIKKVVMPLIDDEAKILLKVTNLIESKSSDTRLIDNPEIFFGETIPIIKIKPTEINSDADNVSLDNPVNISEFNNSGDKPSGTVFVPTAGVDWYFIPFNYKHNERKKQFEIALAKHHLTLNEIDTIKKIKSNKSKIINAYEAVDGDLNKNSMILFSGKNKNDQIQCFEHPYYCCFHSNFHLTIHSGCLYMGDIDLNEPNIVTDIKAKLRSLFLFIGTLQIPHHGSIHNFTSSILQSGIHCAIFSYGTTNTYGHPSDSVISDIITNNIYPHLVTGEQISMVTQWK